MSIKKVAVCGAGGTMGAGIALVAARAGFETVCFDLSIDALEHAGRRADQFFSASVERGKMTAAEKSEALGRMKNTSSLKDLADVDLVIEAVFEDLQVKRALFSELNSICQASTIFASNTSTLSITEIASGCGREERVVGMHFCLPAERNRLIEMSRGMNTQDDVFHVSWQWTEAALQIPVETQDKPGFILNALLVPFNNDVIRAVEAGLATPSDIDKAICTALGYKMGPCLLLDMIGTDTQVLLSEAFYPVTLDVRASAPPLLRRMAAAGHLGAKSGMGFLAGHDPVEEPVKKGVTYELSDLSLSSYGFDNEFLGHATESGDVLVHLGGSFSLDESKRAVLVELDTECLGVHTGEDLGNEGSNVVGFSRYRNGNDAPTQLIEVVRQPNTSSDAVDAARSLFVESGYEVVVCADQPGRIVDRLVRPKYNAALRFLDEGLATAEAMDLTCRLGLGYPDGPIERVGRGGLARHYEISKSIFDLTGLPGYVPARRSVVAYERTRLGKVS